MQSEKGGGNGKDISKDGPQKLGNLERSSSSSDESESSSKIINEVADEISLLNKLQYPEGNDNDSQQEQLAAVLNNNNNSTPATANNNSSIRGRPGAFAIDGPNFDTTDGRDVGAQGGVLFVPGDSILQRNQNQQQTANSRLSSSSNVAPPPNRTSLVDIPVPSVEATLIPEATVQNDSNKDRNKVYMATKVDDDNITNDSNSQKQIDTVNIPLTQLKSETSLDRQEVLSERIVKAAQQSR